MQSDNLTESIYEPHRIYVRNRTGNKGLWRIQECPWGRHSNPALCLCCTMSLLHFLSQFMACKHTFCSNSTAHTSLVQEVPHSTRTFLILPLDAALLSGDNGRNEKQWGRMFFWRGGAYCTSFPWAAQQRPLRASWDEWTRRATSVQNVQGPKISRRPLTTCPETEGEMAYCSPLLLPPLLHPPLLARQINSKSC